MGKNVDWAYLGVPAQLQRRILAPVAEVLKVGYGSVLITIHQHRITDIAKTEKERMTE